MLKRTGQFREKIWYEQNPFRAPIKSRQHQKLKGFRSTNRWQDTPKRWSVIPRVRPEPTNTLTNCHPREIACKQEGISAQKDSPCLHALSN